MICLSANKSDNKNYINAVPEPSSSQYAWHTWHPECLALIGEKVNEIFSWSYRMWCSVSLYSSAQRTPWMFCRIVEPTKVTCTWCVSAKEYKRRWQCPGSGIILETFWINYNPMMKINCHQSVVFETIWQRVCSPKFYINLICCILAFALSFKIHPCTIVSHSILKTYQFITVFWPTIFIQQKNIYMIQSISIAEAPTVPKFPYLLRTYCSKYAIPKWLFRVRKYWEMTNFIESYPQTKQANMTSIFCLRFCHICGLCKLFTVSYKLHSMDSSQNRPVVAHETV